MSSQLINSDDAQTVSSACNIER